MLTWSYNHICLCFLVGLFTFETMTKAAWLSRIWTIQWISLWCCHCSRFQRWLTMCHGASGEWCVMNAGMNLICFDVLKIFVYASILRIIISKMIYMSCVSSLEMQDVHQGKRRSFQVFSVLVSDLSVSHRSLKAEKDHVKQWPNMPFSWENISWRSTNDQCSGFKTPGFCCKFERCKKEMFTVKHCCCWIWFGVAKCGAHPTTPRCFCEGLGEYTIIGAGKYFFLGGGGTGTTLVYP